MLAPRISIANLLSKDFKQRLQQISWHIAGWAVIMDWLGSDASFFAYKTQIVSLEEYWQHALVLAEKILIERDFINHFDVVPFSSVLETFGFQPTPLQQWAEMVEIDATPQLFILEDMTGAGKTEAALTLVHRLMQEGGARGFYFGLPTMATSNAMFSRISEHYLNMLNTEQGKKPSIVLAHSAKNLSEKFQEAVLNSEYADHNYERNDFTATAQCNVWLADSNKKALLAPVGVGTIDQALLAVLPRRHQSVRLFGLMNKVLVIDEVHAADAYMLELLASLLRLHYHTGGSAILLTATLATHQRQKLIDTWLSSLQGVSQRIKKTDFPLATKVSIKPSPLLDDSYIPVVEEETISIRSTKNFKINFVHSESGVIEKIINSINEHKSVVWIRNSVDEAVSAYEQLNAALSDKAELEVILFHSRFVLKDRQAIEHKVLTRLGKKSGAERKHTVVIATQVFQESLDVDADVMISDICPIDDLIQRAGRLYRHKRNAEGFYDASLSDDSRGLAELWVHAPEWTDNPEKDWLEKKFRNTEYVYKSPGRLWLGQKVLRELGEVKLPFNARYLIESVYSEEALLKIPENLKPKEDAYIGQTMAHEASAFSNVLKWESSGYSTQSNPNWYEDDIEISTRLSEVRYKQVVLLRATESKELNLWYQEDAKYPQLSMLKMPERTDMEALFVLPPEHVPSWEALKKKYPQLKFVQPWLITKGQPYSYDSTKGVYRAVV